MIKVVFAKQAVFFLFCVFCQIIKIIGVINNPVYTFYRFSPPP